MLKQLFQTQYDVLRGLEQDIREQVHSGLGVLSQLTEGISGIAGKVGGEYLSQVLRMIADSQRVQKSILDLLDLQEKEESLREAQSASQQALFAAKQALSAQDQADSTEAQSWILFIFTFVTVVFLPLSFFTSFFGMNISNDEGESKTYSQSHVDRVIWGSSAAITAFLFLGASALYFTSIHKVGQSRTRELIKLEDQGYLPRDLIGPDDPEQENMRKMRQTLPVEPTGYAVSTGATAATPLGIENKSATVTATGKLPENEEAFRRRTPGRGDNAV